MASNIAGHIAIISVRDSWSPSLLGSPVIRMCRIVGIIGDWQDRSLVTTASGTHFVVLSQDREGKKWLVEDEQKLNN